MKKIVFCGGDKRELLVMKALKDAGYNVLAYGCPADMLPYGVALVENIASAFLSVSACILPQPPIKKDGELHSLCEGPVFLKKEDFDYLPYNTPILCGVAPPFLTEYAPHCRIFEIAEDDDLAIALAPANAEGAIAEAISISGQLLSGHTALLLGYGRIGKELAWRLEGMGMKLIVLNRGKKRRREAEELGYTTIDRSCLVQAALEADYIFNTVPALLLDSVIISLLDKNTNIIDLAAYPGGTDFAAASRKGMNAILAGGLPGKYAPEFAGETMAAFVPEFINALISEEVQHG